MGVEQKERAMCGAARFRWKDLLDPLIAKGIPIGPQPKPTQEPSATSADTDTLYESRYWSGEPILPVVHNGVLALCRWGNRNETRAYPPSGWAKNESYAAGVWDRYEPTMVTIPLVAGYEKGVWYGIDHGVRGLVVGAGAYQRVYMLTTAADAAYAQLTDHDSMQCLIDHTVVVPHAGSLSQLLLL